MRRFHRANLAVMSVGGAPNMNGPLEAAYVMNELVQPNSIIITHVNEQATDGGKVRSGIDRRPIQVQQDRGSLGRLRPRSGDARHG